MVSGVEHKVKVEFYTDYGVKVFSEEKTAKIPDNSPPVFSDIADAYMENGQAVLSFAPAFKPGSIKEVSFPIWTPSGGQDDLIWHPKQVAGTTTGTWSTTVDISEHKNGTDTVSYTHLDVYKRQVVSPLVKVLSIPAKVKAASVPESIKAR